jgi:hypothetical protein
VDKHFGYIKKLKKKNLLGNVLDYDQEVWNIWVAIRLKAL